MAWRFIFMLVLAGCASVGAVSRSGDTQPGHPHPQGMGLRGYPAGTAHPSPSGSRALALQVIRSVPERNLYVLTDQLRLRPPRPIPHVVRRYSPNYTVGHQDAFYVLGENKNRYFVMHAAIKVETPHLYIYVQNGLNFSKASLQKAADIFEHSTYPTDRSFFGSEWLPGVDGDPHITCLIGDLKSSGVGGYFSAEDEYTHLVNRYSNQREMFYIESGGADPGSASFNSTLAHEFQHMIHFHMHPHENLWLNEGMSMLAEKLNGYPVIGEPSAFVSEPGTQLDTWNQTASASVAHYGAAYLFLSYLYDRFGRGMIHDILADKKYTDFELINDVLKRRHIHTTADALFKQWVVANYVNDGSIAGGIYGYKQLPSSVNAQKTTSLPFSYHASIPPYAAHYVVMNSLQGQSPFRLRFSASTSVPVVGVQHATPFWWSNRGDMMDTRLIRTVDLRKVRHATLHFKTWYDIEKNYDYAYVEVSQDGGKTWDTIRGTHTTTSNPNGASYGNAYTGTIKSFLTESMDLSRYAGRRVLLRLEYITDEGYNGQSWVVKDLTIPEIGWRDNFTGWTPQGFVPVSSNALPDSWTVQLISYTTKGIEVTSMPLKNDAGSVTVDPAKQGLKKLVAVIYAAAPKTTVKSSFDLSAERG